GRGGPGRGRGPPDRVSQQGEDDPEGGGEQPIEGGEGMRRAPREERAGVGAREQRLRERLGRPPGPQTEAGEGERGAGRVEGGLEGRGGRAPDVPRGGTEKTGP